MRCPNCKLENPPSATVCDCGYTFVSDSQSEGQSVYYLRSIAETVNSIKRLMEFWILLTLIGAVIWGLLIYAKK